MIEAMRQIGTQFDEAPEARVGIHSGDIVAGAIGQHRFIYDVRGGTVKNPCPIEHTLYCALQKRVAATLRHYGLQLLVRSYLVSCDDLVEFALRRRDRLYKQPKMQQLTNSSASQITPCLMSPASEWLATSI
jgi:hypothetical protein